MKHEHRVRNQMAKLVKKYLVHWYAVTTLLYAAAIPFTIFLFPATTLILTVIVLFSGFTASIASLASVLVDVDDSKRSE
jgi:hypothetical protein